MNLRAFFCVLLSFVLSPAALAQFNNEWLEFVSSTRIKNPDGSIATHITTDTQEKDFAWGDLNKDGWQDIVIVRKTPVSFPGKRVNYLLMNEGGTLVDRTTQYASASNFPGDQGFNTPTDDRDAEIVDLNMDGWLDVVTSPTDLVGEPVGNKYLSHPRIYINLGNDGSGAWQGLRYEEDRIPLLYASVGVPGTVRFCDSHFGDVTGDGAPDLYFVDYDLTENGFPEAGGTDLNDRLLVNDGNGYFTDETSLRMSFAMSTSEFGTACEIHDLNGDGRKDVLKCTTLFGSLAITASYNDAAAGAPNGVGFFDVFQSNAFTGSPYHLAAGDLNNDGLIDLVKSDDGADQYRFNMGNTALGSVNWSPAKTFAHLSGSGDEGFSGSDHIADLNNDGWNDVFIADVDVDLLGCNRRAKIYHNPGGAVGSTTIQLVEEKQQSGSGGWFGAKGLLPSDMTGTFDAALVDLDNDGDKDMVLGRCSGTFVWINKTDPVHCEEDLGFGTAGGPVLSVCGGAPLTKGFTSDLLLENAPASALAYAVASTASNPTLILGGTLVPLPILILVPLATDAAGKISLPGIVQGGSGPASLYLQFVVADGGQPSGWSFSNAVRIDLLP